KPYGYMYTDKDTYLDFDLRFDWRFVPYPGMESESEFYGNSGTFLFFTKLQVWPPYIEIQPNLSVTITGAKATAKVDDEARRRAPKPVGQWNSTEIVSENRTVKSYMNGILVSTVTEHEYGPGHLGFQSEGSEVQWRNIRVKSVN